MQFQPRKFHATFVKITSIPKIIIFGSKNCNFRSKAIIFCQKCFCNSFSLEVITVSALLVYSSFKSKYWLLFLSIILINLPNPTPKKITQCQILNGGKSLSCRKGKNSIKKFRFLYLESKFNPRGECGFLSKGKNNLVKSFFEMETKIEVFPKNWHCLSKLPDNRNFLSLNDKFFGQELRTIFYP